MTEKKPKKPSAILRAWRISFEGRARRCIQRRVCEVCGNVFQYRYHTQTTCVGKCATKKGKHKGECETAGNSQDNLMKRHRPNHVSSVDPCLSRHIKIPVIKYIAL